MCHKLKGGKPDFHDAMAGQNAKKLYELMIHNLRKSYSEKIGSNECVDKIQGGAFGEHMDIDCTNDGPVTLVLDSIND